MKKLKIYIETSAISDLQQPNEPKFMSDMITLWEKIKLNEYEVVLSDIVFEELEGIKDKNKLNILYNFIDQIDYMRIQLNDEVDKIADLIVMQGILTKENFRDCQHLACALIGNCDCIVSYNFKHINRINTITGIQRLAILHGYGIVNIVDAEKLI